ncbi:unnamed protein product [Clavelina lepadiformis]|uniref:Uncharacterized protein n=1 Tax=Clavelina lepadiformis TaxID=159417 RepID=A0ABP0EZ44_CLALP
MSKPLPTQRKVTSVSGKIKTQYKVSTRSTKRSDGSINNTTMSNENGEESANSPDDGTAGTSGLGANNQLPTNFLLADLTLHDKSPKLLMRELISAVGQENLTAPVVKLIRAKFLKALPPDVAIALASVEHDNLQNLASKAHEVLLLKQPKTSSRNFSLAITYTDDIDYPIQPQIQQSQLSKPPHYTRSNANNAAKSSGQRNTNFTNHNSPNQRNSFNSTWQQRSPRTNNGEFHKPNSNNVFNRDNRRPHGSSFPNKRNYIFSHSSPTFPPCASDASNGLCYYHARFGRDARRCHPSCTMWENHSRPTKTCGDRRYINPVSPVDRTYYQKRLPLVNCL